MSFLERLRVLAAERRWFGYRRLGYLLARDGLKPNYKKLLRIYREEGQQALMAILRCSKERGVEGYYVAPGKPT